jgi:hypothetical protein
MKYSTAKKYIAAYRASAAKRGITIDRKKLYKALRAFEAGLTHCRLIGKY